jgi:hypothetical protein
MSGTGVGFASLECALTSLKLSAPIFTMPHQLRQCTFAPDFHHVARACTTGRTGRPTTGRPEMLSSRDRRFVGIS